MPCCCGGNVCPTPPWDISNFAITLELSGSIYFCGFNPIDCSPFEDPQPISYTINLTDTTGNGFAENLTLTGLPYGGSGIAACELWCPCEAEQGIFPASAPDCQIEVCQPDPSHWWLRFIIGTSNYSKDYPNPFGCGPGPGPDPFTIFVDLLNAGAGSGCEWVTYGNQVAPQVDIGSSAGIIPYGTHTGSFGMIQGRHNQVEYSGGFGCDSGGLGDFHYVHFGDVTCNWTVIISP